jgi:uncharacterized protein YraI
MPEGTRSSGRELSPTLFALEVEGRELPGLGPLARRCGPVLSVKVVPGRLLGAEESRILVAHVGPSPRLASEPGALTLSWPVAQVSSPTRSADSGDRQPPDVAALREENARLRAALAGQESAPAGAQAGIEPATPASPVRPERAAPEQAAPRVASSPAGPVEGGGNVPADFVPLVPAHAMTTVIATEARSGPGRRFRKLAPLPTGTSLVVDGRAGDWVRARQGWVFAAYASEDGAAAGAATVLVVQAVTTPVHSGPGGHHDMVTEFYRGQEVVIDDLQGEWAHVRNGGWVRRSALGPRR